MRSSRVPTEEWRLKNLGPLVEIFGGWHFKSFEDMVGIEMSRALPVDDPEKLRVAWPVYES